MKPKEQVRDLGRRFEIETPHVEHVARLALDLFDGFGLDSGRSLLAAAARLHDIGYASDPDNHVEAGIRILEDNPLPAFSSGDWKLIGLIVSLHRRSWRPVITEELITEFGKKKVEKAKALAAVLRVADGLDHSHIQDASIRFCRRGKKVDKVRVYSRWYPGNVAWAEGKADLWEAVFKRSFRLELIEKQSRNIFDGVVCSGDSMICAVRRVLYSQYCMMRDQVPGILEQNDSEYLHRYRVAMRRFRVALKLFRPLLKNTSAENLLEKLGNLSDELGAARDAQVLFEFFQGVEHAEEKFADIFQTLQLAAQEGHRKAAEVIQSETCQETARLLARFLRVELPEVERSVELHPPFKAFVRKKLDQQLRRLRSQKRSKGLHSFRKRCRRVRYTAELIAPVCGSKTQRLVCRLKKATSLLGDIHDIHLHARKLEELGFHRLEKRESLLASREAEFSKVWKKLISS